MMQMRPDQISRFPAVPVPATVALSSVRSEFGSWLRDVGFERERIDDLLVVASELLANAVRETPEGADPAVFAAALDDRSLTIEVTNEVDADLETPADLDWDLNDPLRTGGRGLMLVAAFVDDVDVDVDGHRLVVRCSASR